MIEQSIKDNPLLMTRERARDLQSFMKNSLDAKSEQPLIQGSYVLLEEFNEGAESIGGSPFGRLARVFDPIRDLKALNLPMAPTKRALAWTAGIAFLAALLFWRLWPRKGVQISFEHITAEGGEKPLLDKVLMQDVQHAFWIPRTELDGGGSLEPVSDRDASGFSGVIPQQPLIPWAEVVETGTPIKVGPVAFDLRQIVVFLLSPLRIRRRSSLVGFLHEDGKRSVIVAQQLNWRNKPVKGCSWRAVGKEGESRQDLIDDLAAQIIIQLKKSAITTDCKSYRCFCQGLRALATAGTPGVRNPCEHIERARTFFQGAVAHDSANWMARFYLGVCLCRCGENEAAADHFDILEKLLCRADAALGDSKRRPIAEKGQRNPVVEHLRTYPQCAFLVMYNNAMALSGTLRSSKLDKALNEVDRLLGAVNACPGEARDFPNSAKRLASSDRKRFSMLAWSARACILATQAEQTEAADAGRKRATIQALEATRKEIASALKRVKGYLEDLEPELLTDHTLAYATLLNAKGRVEMALSRTGSGMSARKAEVSFRQAQAYLPNLADSYLNLIKLYLCARREFGRTWKMEAEKQLRDLQQVAPDNAQAKSLEGKLAASEGLGDALETSIAEADVRSDSSFADCEPEPAWRV